MEEFERVLACYQERHRHYHTLQHLDECFKQFRLFLPQLPPHPGEIMLALWYHDVVYDTHAKDNEARSAEQAYAAMTAYGLPEETCQRVSRLILATRHDAQPSDEDEAALVDCDLAILGSDPERFAEYEKQVRQEYAWVSEEDYRKGRLQVLQGFEQRPALFCTELFRTRYEAVARRNLAFSIAMLKKR